MIINQNFSTWRLANIWMAAKGNNLDFGQIINVQEVAKFWQSWSYSRCCQKVNILCERKRKA